MDRQQILKEIQDQSKSKFSQLRTQALQEAVRNLSAAAAGDSSSGGGNGLPSSCIQFIVDTTDDTNFGMSFTSTGEPITFTIDWGDGTSEEGYGAGGYYEEYHTFPEPNTQYTVRICWDDPSKILELEFFGND